MVKPTHLKLPIIMYNVTEVCQLRCKHCYNESGAGKYTPSSDRLRSGLEKVIAAGAGTINFTGGEPFFVRGMTDLVFYIRSRGLNTMLNTNGVLLFGSRGHQFLEQLEGNLDLIKIGLSGASAETNDYIRGRGNFDVAKRALSVISEHDSIAPCLKICLDKHNVYEIEDIVRFALEYGVKELFFGQLVNTGRARKEIASLVLSYDSMTKVGDELERMHELYGSMIRIAKYCSLNGKCQDQGVYFTITSQGAVGPCLLREDLAVGNIHQVTDAKELFNYVESRRSYVRTHPCLKDLSKETKPQNDDELIETQTIPPSIRNLLYERYGGGF